MEAQGELFEFVRDYQSGKFRATFEFEQININGLLKLKGKPLTVTAKPYRKKRSVNANAYCWELCTKIAEVINSSKDEVYEEMIQRYGSLARNPDGVPVAFNREDIEVIGPEHFYPKDIGNGMVVLLKGSSQCDTKEMSVLLDGIVSECKELDIETKTPDELERIKALWKG